MWTRKTRPRLVGNNGICKSGGRGGDDRPNLLVLHELTRGFSGDESLLFHVKPWDRAGHVSRETPRPGEGATP